MALFLSFSPINSSHCMSIATRTSRQLFQQRDLTLQLESFIENFFAFFNSAPSPASFNAFLFSFLRAFSSIRLCNLVSWNLSSGREVSFLRPYFCDRRSLFRAFLLSPSLGRPSSFSSFKCCSSSATEVSVPASFPSLGSSVSELTILNSTSLPPFFPNNIQWSSTVCCQFDNLVYTPSLLEIDAKDTGNPIRAWGKSAE